MDIWTVLLPKNRGAEPPYQRWQRFSKESPTSEGEKVGPYVLEKVYSQLHAAPFFLAVVIKHLLAMMKTGAQVDFQEETGTVQRAARPEFSRGRLSGKRRQREREVP